MEIEEEPINFIDIAKRTSEVRVQVPPSRMLKTTAPWHNKNANETVWSTPLTKAVIEDDFEAFVQLLSIAHSLPGDVLDASAVLNDLLAHDRPVMLDEFIRRTGEGIDLWSHRMSLSEDQASHETSSKVYLGLNVHGKKRKDLATKGDPNAPQTYQGTIVPSVWTALRNGLTATVRYLASDQPLAAYRFYASAHGDEKAKLLQQISDLGAALPVLLGWSPNAVNETAATASILSDRADMLEMLLTLRPKETQDQLQLRYVPRGSLPLAY